MVEEENDSSMASWEEEGKVKVVEESDNNTWVEEVVKNSGTEERQVGTSWVVEEMSRRSR